MAAPLGLPDSLSALWIGAPRIILRLYPALTIAFADRRGGFNPYALRSPPSLLSQGHCSPLDVRKPLSPPVHRLPPVRQSTHRASPSTPCWRNSASLTDSWSTPIIS